MRSDSAFRLKFSIGAMTATAVVAAALVSCGGGGGSSGGGGTAGGGGGGGGDFLKTVDLGANVSPVGIDDSGRVFANTPSGPVVISNGLKQSIPKLPNGGTPTLVAVNASGVALISSMVGGSAGDNYLLSGSNYTVLKRTMVSGAISQGIAISSNGEVIGTGNVLWTSATASSVYTAPTGFVGLAINSSGVIVGTIPSGEYYKIQGGTAADLHDSIKAGLTFGGEFRVATINDSGVIAVQSGDAFDIITSSGVATGPYGVIYGTMSNAGAIPSSNGPTPTWPQPSGAIIFDTTDSKTIQFNAYRAPSDKSSLYYYTSGVNSSRAAVGVYYPGGNTATGHGFLSTLPSAAWGAGSITVGVAPKSLTLEGGGVQKFTVAVAGSSNQTVAWTVDETNGGTIDASGNFTAPLVAGTYHVRATSKADSTIHDEATVTVQSIGGDSGATYQTPIAVAGPSTPFMIAQVLPTGQMVGYTKPTTGQSQPLYWSSPTATPTALPLDAYQGASVYSLALVGGNVEFVGTATFKDSQGLHGDAVVWTTPTSSPTLLRDSSGNTGAFAWINAQGQLIFGSHYWTSYTATGTALPGFPDSALGVMNVLSNSGYVGLLGSNPLVYKNLASNPVALTGSGTPAAYAMSNDGAMVGGDLINSLSEPVFWSPADGFAAEHVLPTTAQSQATLAGGIGDNGWIVGATTYPDGTGGAPLWMDVNHVVDLRALIPQGTGWKIAQGQWVLSDGSIVGSGKTPSGAAAYFYTKPK